jgi:YD repeat-containing protein
MTLNGVTTSYTYDSQGNMATKTTPGGGVYTYSDYKLGAPQAETQPEAITIARVIDDSGNVISETNGEGYTTLYTYDGLNRLTSVTPPSGYAQTITYTPTSKTSVRGTLTETTQYDPFGRVASVTRGGIKTTRTYDAYSRLTFISDPNATVGTSYQYDVLGRVIKVTNADATFQTTAYGPATRVVTDERGKVTTYTYRGYGDPDKLSLMAITAPDPAANVALDRNTREQVTSVTQGGFTRTYGYNDNGYLTSINNPETGDTLYGRDIAGNMISSQTGASGVTSYTYDGLNRQTAIDYPSGTPPVRKTYDKTGNLLTSSTSGGIRSFAYNAVGSVTQERLSLDGKLFKLSYAYDGNDRLRSVTYNPSGRVIEFNPDVFGRPTTVSGYVDNATYWPSGMLKRLTYANGTVSSYGQNERLWPAFFTTETGAGTEYLKSAYTYDGVGNLLTVNDFVDNSMDRTLSYDAVNRLTGADGFWGTGTLSYDGVGNLTQQSFGNSSLTYNYDAQNRLASVNGQRVASMAYDAYGNISSNAGNTYTYNAVPNLVCVNCGNAASQVEYQYDGLNQRSSVSYAGNKVYEMQDSEGKLRMELEGDTLTEYFYLGDKRVAQRVSP